MARKARRNQSTQQSNKAVIYTRVSSKDQKEEGFSIEAQQNLLREYAEKNGLEVVREYTDAETATAKHVGRPAFGKMVSFLQAQSQMEDGANIILVEKTDRLHRNIKDWGTIGDLIDESNVSLHLVKEGTVLSRDSRSSEKFIYEIRSVMAKHYSDNLSEEVKKGMETKARLGIFPSFAPVGYRNVKGPDGRNVIEVDPVRGPLVRKLFEWYATGEYTVAQVAKKARAHGLTYRSGNRITTSTVHSLLRHRLFTGWFDWGGKIYHGIHEPLVPLEIWDLVQNIMDDRHANKYPLQNKHQFSFSQLMRCKSCGSSVVGEIKKGKYVYYHCTGRMSGGGLLPCRRKYVREEVLEKQFSEILGRIQVEDEVLEMLKEALRSSRVDQKQEHSGVIRDLQAEYDRLEARISAVYEDKLDGKVSDEFFKRKSNEYHKAQIRCLVEIEHCQDSQKSYMDEGVRILKFAASAQQEFHKQDSSGKRGLLQLVCSNSELDNGKVIPNFRKPFTTLIKTKIAASKETTQKAKTEKWLPLSFPFRAIFCSPCKEVRATLHDFKQLNISV